VDLFLGRENYDGRIDNGGLFGLKVLAILRLRCARIRHLVTDQTSFSGSTIASLSPRAIACQCCRAVHGDSSTTAESDEGV
jgi:hypothetical protein